MRQENELPGQSILRLIQVTVYGSTQLALIFAECHPKFALFALFAIHLAFAEITSPTFIRGSGTHVRAHVHVAAKGSHS
jgi:hypothetical protein